MNRWAVAGLCCVVAFGARLGEGLAAFNASVVIHQPEIRNAIDAKGVNVLDVAAEVEREPALYDAFHLGLRERFVFLCGRPQCAAWRQWEHRSIFGLGAESRYISTGEWKRPDPDFAVLHHVISRGLSRVFEQQMYGWPAAHPKIRNPVLLDKDVSSQLPFVAVLSLRERLSSDPGRLPCLSNSVFCRPSGFSSLAKHAASGFSSASGVVERPPYQANTNGGEKGRYGSCEKHRFCPVGHILLGFQILYLVLGGALGLGGSLLCYKVADRGLDLSERGRKIIGTSVFFLAFTAGPSLIGCFLFFGYGLAFENGWRAVLG